MQTLLSKDVRNDTPGEYEALVFVKLRRLRKGIRVYILDGKV